MSSLAEQFLNDALAFNIADRNKLAMVTLTKVIAYKLAIPSSPVDNPELYYISNHLTFVNNAVSHINETIVINVDAFVNAVKAIWLTRYRVVFTPSTPEANDAINAALCNKVLGAEYCEFLTINASTINTLTFQYVESINARSLEY